MKPIPFVDLGGPQGIPEDDRIQMIGQRAMLGDIVGFFVESDGEKGDRYIAKLKSKFPQLVVVFRGQFTEGTELIKVQIPAG
jgi:hypothetical protein